MEERQIVEKLTLLKNITPRQDWVLSVKSQVMSHMAVDNSTKSRILQGGFVFNILGELASAARYFEKPAFAFAGLLLIVGGGVVLQVSAGSLPGDPLYSIKSAREQIELALSSSNERPFVQLELAQRRLDELKQVTEQNRTKDLAAAIKGYQKRVSQVSQAIPGLVGQNPGTALLAGKTILQLKKDKQELERALGTTFGEAENADLTEATRLVVESELKDLKTRTLNEPQMQLMMEAEIAYEAGEYDASLEYLLKVGPVLSGENSAEDRE